MRLESRDKMTLADAERPTEFQKIRQPSKRYLAIPEVSSESRDYVPIAFFDPMVVPTNKIQVVENESLSLFGILCSRVFSIWVKNISGRLKSDFSISSEITYNNFPFPETAPEQSEQIELAAKQVLDMREKYPNSSLADLYDPNAMPSDLRKAHQQLDKAVLKAFGLKATATDEEILADLFRRYAELTKGLI